MMEIMVVMMVNNLFTYHFLIFQNSLAFLMFHTSSDALRNITMLLILFYQWRNLRSREGMGLIQGHKQISGRTTTGI